MKEMPTLTLSESVLNLMEKITGVKPKVSTTVNLESCLNDVKMLQSDEKAAYALLPAYTFERSSQIIKMRKELLESNKVQAVICLPYRLLVNTNISVSIVVIGKNDTDKIMIVNASGIYSEENRSRATLTDEDIQKISTLCSEETDISKYVSISKIAENDYDLSPSRYIKPELKNPIRFGELVKAHRCGLQLTPDQRNDITSEAPTKWQYAQTADIINGELDPELSYLNEFKESYLNHQIKNNDLVISKLGSPVKIAVAEVKDDQSVIGVGRLYIFEIDTEKADPFKIKKFLSSSTGQEILSSCARGTVISNLDIDSILDMQIPYDEVKA